MEMAAKVIKFAPLRTSLAQRGVVPFAAAATAKRNGLC